jgi:hypothetical protein
LGQSLHPVPQSMRPGFLSGWQRMRIDRSSGGKCSEDCNVGTCGLRPKNQFAIKDKKSTKHASLPRW